MKPLEQRSVQVIGRLTAMIATGPQAVGFRLLQAALVLGVSLIAAVSMECDLTQGGVGWLNSAVEVLDHRLSEA